MVKLTDKKVISLKERMKIRKGLKSLIFVIVILLCLPIINTMALPNEGSGYFGGQRVEEGVQLQYDLPRVEEGYQYSHATLYRKVGNGNYEKVSDIAQVFVWTDRSATKEESYSYKLEFHYIKNDEKYSVWSNEIVFSGNYVNNEISQNTESSSNNVSELDSFTNPIDNNFLQVDSDGNSSIAINSKFFITQDNIDISKESIKIHYQSNSGEELDYSNIEIFRYNEGDVLMYEPNLISKFNDVFYTIYSKYKGNNVKGKSGDSATIEGLSAISIQLEEWLSNFDIEYRIHNKDQGWQSWVKNGEIAGEEGSNKYINAIQIKLVGAPINYQLEYRVILQDGNWSNWKGSNEEVGDIKSSSPIGGIQIRLKNNNGTFENDKENKVLILDHKEVGAYVLMDKNEAYSNSNGVLRQKGSKPMRVEEPVKITEDKSLSKESKRNNKLVVIIVLVLIVSSVAGFIIVKQRKKIKE